MTSNVATKNNLFNSLFKINKLKFDEFSFGYSDYPITPPFSFEACAGNIIAVLGPNGTGKTTFLRSINQIIKPIQGNVILNGSCLTNFKKKELAKYFSYLPQADNKNTDFTVFNYVIMGRYPHQSTKLETKEDIDITVDALNFFELLPFKNTPVSKLSGGQFQRVLLARHVVQQTPINLLDEPNNHLDPSSIKLLHECIKSFQENKHIVFVASHNISWVFHACTHAILIGHNIPVQMHAVESLYESGMLEKTFNTEFIRIESDNGDRYVIPRNVL